MPSFDKDEKAIDITTKYTELLITLASGTIVACIAFFGDISKVPGINLQNVKYALLLMAISIVAGLFTLGRIIGVLQFGKKPEILTPYERWIRLFSTIQLFTYGLGMLLIWLGITTIPSLIQDSIGTGVEISPAISLFFLQLIARAYNFLHLIA